MKRKIDEATDIGALIVKICLGDKESYIGTIRQKWAMKMLVWSVFDDFELKFDVDDKESKERVYEKAVALIKGINQYFHEHYDDELPPMFEGKINDLVLQIIRDRWALVNWISDKTIIKFP